MKNVQRHVTVDQYTLSSMQDTRPLCKQQFPDRKRCAKKMPRLEFELETFLPLGLAHRVRRLTTTATTYYCEHSFLSLPFICWAAVRPPDEKSDIVEIS